MTFADDLRRFGPDHAARCSREEALAYCARLTATHYENFSVVTWLTPRELRPHFASIYAFCRWADDLGDEVGDRDESRRLLQWWRDQTEALYQGQTAHPVMIALAETVSEFAIPIDPFLALISAFEQDQDVLEYRDREQLLDYCTRSADPVGHLVLYLGRCFNEENARLSNFTCTGLQLANFWQDVSRDLHALGRIYLPAESRERFGVTRQDLQEGRATEGFRRLMEFEVAEARKLLVQGITLVQRMPRELAVDVELFNQGGLAILDRIVAANYDVLTSRPKLSKATKARLLLRALWKLHSPFARVRASNDPAMKIEAADHA